MNDNLLKIAIQIRKLEKYWKSARFYFSKTRRPRKRKQYCIVYLFMFNYRELYSGTVVLALPHGHVVRLLLPDDVAHLPIVLEGAELEIKFIV